MNRLLSVRDEGSPDLLGAEDCILPLIAARAPLPSILNAICCALDCRISNLVSLISVPGDAANDFAFTAMNARRFGLHLFWSGRIISGTQQLVGSLDMFCSVRRGPSVGELALIERGKCLAGLAIEIHNKEQNTREMPAMSVSGDPRFRAAPHELSIFLN